MFVYMQLILSKFNYIEIRVILGTLGLLCVSLSFVSSFGIGSLFGLAFSSVHSSLPFLLMGLNVDDIFVMMTHWRKIQCLEYDQTLPERIGLMLKHAGIPITITSFTDITAFLVGATTVVPTLRTFCLFAVMAVFIMYLLIITLFVAIFTLDEKRIGDRRNAFIPFIKHDESKLKCWCDLKLMDRIFDFVYSKIVLTKIGKVYSIIVIISSKHTYLYSSFNLNL